MRAESHRVLWWVGGTVPLLWPCPGFHCFSISSVHHTHTHTHQPHTQRPPCFFCTSDFLITSRWGSNPCHDKLCCAILRWHRCLPFLDTLPALGMVMSVEPSFSLDWSITAAVGWIAVNIGRNIEGLQRMNPNDFGDHLTFHPAAQTGQISHRHVGLFHDYTPLKQMEYFYSC